MPYCNLYVGKELAEQNIYFPKVNANDQRTYLENSKDWQSIGLDHQKAFDLAKQGNIVVVSYKNPDPLNSGHIGFVDPLKGMRTRKSDRWGDYIPYVQGYITSKNKVGSYLLSSHISGKRKMTTEYYIYRRD